mmetsp:Transcript_37678/g.43279  ORF Transcript_37678/g.43279 Transcript_37678/m.43279 type:complete len:221 (-) Transcript_37678:569-1231(-)
MNIVLRAAACLGHRHRKRRNHLVIFETDEASFEHEHGKDHNICGGDVLSEFAFHVEHIVLGDEPELFQDPDLVFELGVLDETFIFEVPHELAHLLLVLRLRICLQQVGFELRTLIARGLLELLDDVCSLVASTATALATFLRGLLDARLSERGLVNAFEFFEDLFLGCILEPYRVHELELGPQSVFKALGDVLVADGPDRRIVLVLLLVFDWVLAEFFSR